MIDPLISVVVTILSWVLRVIADIALAFSWLSYHAADIPGVGTTLASWFASIAGFFDDLWFDVRDLSTGVQNVLNAIDDWLDKVKNLWDQVFGWILDKLDDAYQWAQQAIDQVVDLADDVGDLLYAVFTSIPGKLSSLWDKINTILYELFTSIPGKLSSLWDKINTIIAELFTSIPGKLSSLWDKINTLISEVFTSIPGKFSSILETIAALPELIKGMILQPIAPFINLISFFFEDINAFFSDPLGSILSWLTRIARKYEQTLLDIADKIGDALFGD